MLLPSLAFLVAAVGMAAGASFEQVSSFGDNPSQIQMYTYVPDKLADKPAIIVGLHPCGGNARMFYQMTKLPSYADRLGFILIYPGTTKYSNCWDVQTAATLTHGAGGDALSVVNAVNYVLSKYKGDPARVFVMGSSSGAMMTNALAGSYPDVFEAGSAYSGIAFACAWGMQAATPMNANQTCAQGMTHTPEEWGNFVRNAYPGYTGKRTRMQIWHGLADTLVRPQCAVEALKQWSNVMGLENTKNNTGIPSAAYTEYVYGNGSQLVGYLGQGVGHTAPVNEDYMLRFFGLME